MRYWLLMARASLPWIRRRMAPWIACAKCGRRRGRARVIDSYLSHGPPRWLDYVLVLAVGESVIGAIGLIFWAADLL